MANLKETAQAYEPPQTLNIADLEKVSVNVEVKKEAGMSKEGEAFSYHYTEVDGKKYRIPGSVIGGLKGVLTKMPHIQWVIVLREGHGMNTRYQVIPYSPPEQKPQGAAQ